MLRPPWAISNVESTSVAQFYLYEKHILRVIYIAGGRDFNIITFLSPISDVPVGFRYILNHFYHLRRQLIIHKQMLKQLLTSILSLQTRTNCNLLIIGVISVHLIYTHTHTRLYVTQRLCYCLYDNTQCGLQSSHNQ